MAVKSLREDRRPAELWFWNDWFSSFDVRSCSVAARGLWMDMLGVMAKAQIKGTLAVNGKQIGSKDLAKIAGITEDEAAMLLRELEEKEVFSRLDDGTIINRRMYREGELSRKRAEAGRLGGANAKQKEKIGESKTQSTLEDEDENEDEDLKEGGVGGEGKDDPQPDPPTEKSGDKFEPRHLTLACFLRDRITVNVPYHKFTGIKYLEAWARDFRLMEDRDKVPFDMIKAVLEWALEDSFWRGNILSAGTFREKFGRLAAKMRECGPGSPRGPESPYVGSQRKQPDISKDLEKKLRTEYDTKLKKFMAEKGYASEEEMPIDACETFWEFRTRRIREMTDAGTLGRTS